MLVKPIADAIGYIDIAAPRLPKLRTNQILQAQVVGLLPEGKAQIRMLGKVWELRSEVALQKGERLLLQVQERDENGSVRLSVIKDAEDFSFLTKLDPLSIEIETLLSVSNNHRLKRQIDAILLHDIYAKLFKASYKIKETLQQVTQEAPEIAKRLEEFFPKRLEAKEFHELLGRSFVQKMKKLIDSLEDIQQKHRRLSVQLQQMQELLQNYLLLSQLGGAVIYFVPVLWEAVEDSEIVIKHLRRYDIYMCRLYLRFVDSDEVRVTLLLRRKYLQIVFGAQDEAFKERIATNIGALKSSFIGSGIYVDIVVDDFYKERLDSSFFMEESFVDRKI